MRPTAKKLNLSEWLSWMEQCHPSEIELGLERVSKVADLLAIDLSDSKVVTIAGTNGKGSTVSYLDSIYREAGYSVGCFTSPHFLHYNERVKVNGSNSSDELLCDAFEQIDQARGQIPLTYFEFGTLAALVIFSQLKPDLVLLEVGLGGRLDAVNIIDADVSVVTTVAIDHVDWLGDDREVIGREKSGVFRAGKPAVSGDVNPPDSVAEYANEIGANLFKKGDDFTYSIEGASWCWQGLSLEGKPVELSSIPMPQLPFENAVTVLQTVQCIDLPVTDEAIYHGISCATLTGRMQNIQHDGINYWLDVAHNPEAAGLLADRISHMESDTTLILGMLADKDCQQVVELLSKVVDQIYLVDLTVPRGQKAEALAAYLDKESTPTLFASVSDALIELKNNDIGSGNVIIAGSFFTVSDALVVLGKDA